VSVLPASIRFEKPLDQEVHRILWEEWDPIGVNQIAGEDWEYEAYVLRVAERICAGEDARAIAAYLGQIRAAWGEGAGGADADLTVAERLVALRLRRHWQ
jgi:hypothetical protein